MNQPIQNTDAYLLMEIGRVLTPFKVMPATPARNSAMCEAVRVHADRLLSNGHSREEARGLIAAVWNSL